LATTLSLAQFGIANRFFILALEQKATSEKLAEACVHIARISVYNDPAYVVDTPFAIDVAGGTCTIHSISTNGTEATIKIKAASGKSFTNLSVTINPIDGDFLSWEEVPTL
jgi:hypothetical protein